MGTRDKRQPLYIHMDQDKSKRVLKPYYGTKLCPRCRRKEIDILSKSCRDCFRSNKWGGLARLSTKVKWK